MTRYIDMGTKGKAAAWTKEYTQNEAAAWKQFSDDPTPENGAEWRKCSDRLDAQLRVIGK
jgi:hypothetical protein